MKTEDEILDDIKGYSILKDDETCNATINNGSVKIKVFDTYLLLNDKMYEIPKYAQSSNNGSNVSIEGSNIKINGYLFKNGKWQSNKIDYARNIVTGLMITIIAIIWIVLFLAVI